MKIRNCFVSNSSSCSFVLLGYKLENFECDDPYDHFEKLGLDYESVEYGPELVGKMLLWISDEGGQEISETSFEKLAEIKEEVKQKMGRDDDPKLYSGMTMC